MVPADVTEDMLEWVLDVHLINSDIGSPSSWSMTSKTMVKTESGLHLVIEYMDNSWWITNVMNWKVKITHEVATSSSGRVFGIDHVLMPGNLVDTCKAYNWNSLPNMVMKYNLMDAGTGFFDGSYTSGMTVFLPSETAFANMVALASDDPIVVSDLIRYHIVEDYWPSSSISSGTYNTAAGHNIMINSRVMNGTTTWYLTDARGNTADIIMTDMIFMTWGVIHVIDKVLMPPKPEPYDPATMRYDLFETMYEVELHSFYDLLEDEKMMPLKMWLKDAKMKGVAVSAFIPNSPDADMWFKNAKTMTGDNWHMVMKTVGSMFVKTGHAVFDIHDGEKNAMSYRQFETFSMWNDTKIGIWRSNWINIKQQHKEIWIGDGSSKWAKVDWMNSNYRTSDNSIVHTTDMVLPDIKSISKAIEGMEMTKKVFEMIDPKMMVRNMLSMSNNLVAFIPSEAAWAEFMKMHPRASQNKEAVLDTIKMHVSNTGSLLQMFTLWGREGEKKERMTMYSNRNKVQNLDIVVHNNMIKVWPAGEKCKCADKKGMDMYCCYATVQVNDIVTDNGLVNIIDKVMLTSSLEGRVDAEAKSHLFLILALVFLGLIVFGGIGFLVVRASKAKDTNDDESSLLAEDFGEYDANEI
jgi:uncharacterized surface protein with fasciclin (FAS1) repeats